MLPRQTYMYNEQILNHPVVDDIKNDDYGTDETN
jgi:hypothetical protein